MSLNWDANDCDPQALLDEQARMITQAIVFATMPVGIGHITEKNHEEFFRRLTEVERLAGAYITDWDGERLVERLITLDDVRLRIGLRTNASPLTKRAFDASVRQHSGK